jgi:ComF family protein
LCRGRASASNLCGDCLAGLPRAELACPRCALPVPSAGECGACIRKAPAWDRAFAGTLYEFPVDALVGLLKYRGQLAAAPALAAAMIPAARGGALQNTLLIPVPLHWSRLAGRGYNQSLELASTLARIEGFHLDERSLKRLRRTPAQAGLDAATRRRNLRGAFAWRGPPLAGTRVILVDDVMTTGSTAAACTRVLREAGAGTVDVWVAARAVKSG